MKKITLCLMLILALIIVPGAIFAEENVTEVGDTTALINAVKTSGTVKLTADIDLDERLLIPTGTKITLDLNGKTLDLPTNEEWNNYGITVKGELIVTGKGIVNINGLYGIGTSTSGGNVTIKNGTFNGTQSDYILGAFGGKIVVEEGTFNGNYCIANAFVEYTGAVEVKGGTFNNTETTLVLGNTKVSGGTFNKEILNEYLAEGLVCKKISNVYKVSAEHTITVKEAEGGKIIVREVPTSEAVKEIDKAIYGETVEVVIEPAEGYKFKGISGFEGLKDIAEYAYQFVMPNKDVVLTPIFEKITTEAEVPSNVANAEKVEAMLIETLKNNKDFAEIIKDKNVEIKVEVKEKEVTNSEKETIETAVSKEVADIKVVNYMDITIYVKDADNGKNLGNLETVKETITFTVPVPEDLPELAEGFRRIFYIVRDHNGDIDVWEVAESDGKLEFESDKFSTYAIAYKDVENSAEGGAEAQPEDNKEDNKTENKVENKPTTPDVPKTGDNVVVFAVIAIVAIAGMAVTIKMRKK